MQTLMGLFLFYVLLTTDPATAVQVTIQNPFNVVIQFQPVTLQCNYQSTATRPPVVIWKYKSYCRSPPANAFNLSSQESQINNQLQQNNSSHNPNMECPDNVRTVRVVASKQGNSMALGDFYQGRNIIITNAADLSIEKTIWEDSGVYYCSVISPQDLQGNNKAYAELIVLGDSLECETCTALGNSCSGQKQRCPTDQDTCMTIMLKGTAGEFMGNSTAKSCYSKEACNLLKPGELFSIVGTSATIKEVTCKAISPSASLLLALSGLLLLKVLF